MFEETAVWPIVLSTDGYGLCSECQVYNPYDFHHPSRINTVRYLPVAVTKASETGSCQNICEAFSYKCLYLQRPSKIPSPTVATTPVD